MGATDEGGIVMSNEAELERRVVALEQRLKYLMALLKKTIDRIGTAETQISSVTPPNGGS